MTRSHDRGQAYITEAILAALLMSAIMITAAASIGAVEPPLSSETKQQQTELHSDLDGVVETTQENGELKSSLLNWNASDRRYDDYETVQNGRGYYLEYPNDRFGAKLQRLANRHDGSVAVEIIPASDPTTTKTGSLPNVEQEGRTLISGGSTSESVVVEETYMTVYPTDVLRAPPSVYAHDTASIPAQNTGTTVYEAYDNAKTQKNTGKIDEVYFPFVPKTTNYDAISDNEPWNTYRVRVIAWF